MTIRNESNFNNYMKGVGSHHVHKELNKNNCVAIFLVAHGITGEKADKWASKGLLTFAPLQTYLAKKGQELVKNFNIKQIERNVVRKEENISVFAEKVLNTNQKAGNQIFVADDHTSRLLTLKQNEDKLQKLFVHHNGLASQRLVKILNADPLQTKFEDLSAQEKKDINFLLVLVYSTDREDLLSKADEAASFNSATGFDIDVYSSPEEWGAKVKEELDMHGGLEKRLKALITPKLFDKSKSDLEIYRNILKMNESLKKEDSPEIFQMLENPDMNYQLFSNFMIYVAMNPATPKRREFINNCNEAKIHPALTFATLNQLEKQWFFPKLSSDEIKDIVKTLKELKNKDSSSIVVALQNHIESCTIKGEDPFSKTQLKNFKSRVDHELTGEQIRERKTEFFEICKKANIDQGLALTVINQIDNQGFIQDLNNETMKRVAVTLEKLSKLGIDPTQIVVGFNDYLDKCNVEGKEPFASKQLERLEARIINPTDMIRTGTEILQYSKEWVDGLPKGSPLVKPFLQEFGFAVPFPHKIAGWEPGDAQKLIFEQIVKFAKDNSNLSPEAIVKAFKRTVITLADRTEYTNADYLKENVVKELKNSSKALQRAAFYAEVEKLLTDKKVPKNQVPVLVEYLMAKVNLGNEPLSKEGHAVLEHLVTLLADPSFTPEEKGRIVSSMQIKLFDLSKIDNVENRIQTLTALFKKPSGVSLAKLTEMMQHKPGSVVTPMFKVLMIFFKDHLDTREGINAEQDDNLGKVKDRLNASSYLKLKLEQALKSFLPKRGGELIELESPEFIRVDLPTFTSGIIGAVDRFVPPPLTLPPQREPSDQAVHKVMQGIINNVARARSEPSGLSLFLTETWPDLQSSFVWKFVRLALTEKNVHLIGRVVANLAGPITFFANRYFDKAIATQRALGNEAKAQLYEEVKGMFKPLLMLATSLVPGIVQKHAILRVGENPINIEGALNILSAAVRDPDFSQDKQNKLLNDLKPYLGELLQELAPYGDLINNLISAAAFQGTEEAMKEAPKQ